jgi:hypothetical protein
VRGDGFAEAREHRTTLHRISVNEKLDRLMAKEATHLWVDGQSKEIRTLNRKQPLIESFETNLSHSAMIGWASPDIVTAIEAEVHAECAFGARSGHA